MKIAVALSGGIDSSVAVYLLKKQGHDVFAITMNHIPDNLGFDFFYHLDDAKKIADFFNIKHFIINIKNTFQNEIIDNFTQSYLNGKTPNPCALCNKKIKFGLLLEKAIEYGADKIATGHYSDIFFSNGKYFIKKAKYIKKDQSYFLSLLNQEQLSKIIFPLSNLTKPEVREIANKNNIPSKEKKESQEICFIKEDYKNFLYKYYNIKDQKGDILNIDGKKIGEHSGFWKFTVGQRRGIGVSANYPLYVIKVNPSKNTIVVGPREYLFKKKIYFENPVTQIKIDDLLNKELDFKIRYNSPPQKGILKKENNKYYVELLEPAYAITDGQLLTGYHNDIVVFGSIINNTINPL